MYRDVLLHPIKFAGITSWLSHHLLFSLLLLFVCIDELPLPRLSCLALSFILRFPRRRSVLVWLLVFLQGRQASQQFPQRVSSRLLLSFPVRPLLQSPLHLSKEHVATYTVLRPVSPLPLLCLTNPVILLIPLHY